jgi:hypothetical protein
VFVQELSNEVIAITYKILGIVKEEKLISVDADMKAKIKEALRERKDWGVISQYSDCQLTLIDGTNGKEI